jgi:two-component system, response regulator
MSTSILLVEDNGDDELLTIRALRKHNLANNIVVARDGAEALEMLHGDGVFGPASGDLPELVLLDLKLPRVEGLEVLRRIRADPRTTRVPVVILTSSDEQQDLIGGYDLRANSYLRKPVDFQEFTEAIRLLGLYWLVLNRTPEPAPGGDGP